MASPSDPPEDLRNRVGDFSSSYHIPVILAVMAFMFWTRYRSASNFVRENGFYLAAIDSYYHYRTTVYTVENWPNTMPYDVWTSFPDGRYVGQFGTAYDQIIATVALIIGLGDPSTELIHRTILVMVPLLAALVAIPVYLIGKRLGGRLAGLGGIALLALFPGQIYARTMTGQHQHHVAEVLFMSVAILALMYALRVAEREKPVFEQVVDRDLDGLRPTILSSAVAGAALGFYQWMWPPGVVLVGIVAVFFVAYLSLEYVLGRSPEHVAFVGVISMTVAGITVLGMIEELSTSPTSFGYISPVLAFGVAAGCLFLAWLSRYWDREELQRWAYAGTTAASVVIFLGLLWLVLPDVFGRMVGDLQGRILPIGADPGTLTIQEARPPSDYTAQAFREFGLAFYTAVLGLMGIILAPFFGAKAKAEHALIVVWSLFLISMSMAQIRFFYYLAIAIAVLNAYLIGWVIEWADLDRAIEDVSSIEAYHVLVLGTVILVLVIPLLPGAAGGATVFDGESGPHQATVQWEESLDYLEGSTPEEGQFGGADGDLDYYGTYEVPADGSYDYPEGAYGVMTWWDYGHLITVDGERIPHANPFQSGAQSASAFLLSETEERANLILDALPTGTSVHDKSTEELAAVVDDRDEQESHEETRYVMVDAPMALGKFGAITDWTGPDDDHYVVQEEVDLGDNESARLPRMSSNYHNTTLASLYFGDANGMERYRLVHESSRMTAVGSIAQEVEDGQWEAAAFHLDLSQLNVPIQELQAHPSFQLYDLIPSISDLKTFERVEGATITGETDAEPGTTVRAMLDLTAETTERNFTYTQETTVEEDGTFALTVPYATSEELGPEDGYTETAVTAQGSYEVWVMDGPFNISESGTVDVPEPGIYEGDEYAVDLEPHEEEENEDTEEDETADTDDGDDA